MNTRIQGFQPVDELKPLGQVHNDYIPRATTKKVGAVGSKVSENIYDKRSST
jgi:hypothetical protein